MEEDHVHQAAQAVHEVDPVHGVVDHRAAHEAHAAEASHVVDAPNQNHQRAAAVPNPSEFLMSYFVDSHRFHFILFSSSKMFFFVFNL